jgi:hypothetical protein
VPVDELSNADVQWDGTYVGLRPVIESTEAERIRQQGDRAVPDLIAALADEDTFAVAHVLLTDIARVSHERLPTWNGLAVDIRADGTVTVEPAQRFDLARRWRQWYETQPRPDRLPT